MDGASLKTANVTAPPGDISAWDRSFFGHPRGLATCFFTEMWERFSYYGMRAILILFLTSSVRGGLGMSDSMAGAVYGLSTSMAYLTTLGGGWVADRILGQRKAVLYGGILISLGNFALGVPGVSFAYFGLFLIVIGTGMLKPNVSTMVSALYRPDDVRRDSGYSIFYMGINLGAFLSPFICGYLGEKINWHYGFIASGVGMTLGVIQYMLTAKYLGSAGLEPATPINERSADRRRFTWVMLGVAALAVIVAVLSLAGIVGLSPQLIADSEGYLLLLTVGGLFGWLLFFGDWTAAERKRFWLIFILFLGATLFWAAYEQAGSTLNLFAERNTDRHVFGYEYPASWFQSVNPIYIFALAPVFAWLWMSLGPKDPSIPTKFSIGLILVGLGFIVMIFGALRAASGVQVSSMYLMIAYLLHTTGELCLSPVGLSAMTKLAPARVVGLTMGVWFLASSVGNYIAGRLASVYGSFSASGLFTIVAAYCIVPGLVIAAFVKPMRRLMGTK